MIRMPDPAFADGGALDHDVVSRIQHRLSGTGPIFSREKIKRLKAEGQVEFKRFLVQTIA